MIKFWIAIPLLLLGSTYSLYTALYYAWVTATPLKEEQLRVYQQFFYYWFFAFLAFLIGTIFCIIRLVIQRRKNSKYQSSGSSESPITPASG